MEKKVEYFDVTDRPLKTQLVPEVVEVDKTAHKWWAKRRELANHQTGHRTVMVTDALDPDKEVREDFFTTRYLEREK
jgi:hypothetical protein